MPERFDARWRAAALAGQADAIDRLARLCLEPLYRFCYYRVACNRAVCEDVVQETLMRAIRDLGRYDPARSGGNIFGWLTGLARNEIRRAVARDRKAASLDQLWERMDRELLDFYQAMDSQPLPDELLERAETRELVNAAMSQLPPHYGAALEAKYVLGRSVRDIAESLGLTEKAVESQLARAREAFRATFTALARNLGLDEPETRGAS